MGDSFGKSYPFVWIIFFFTLHYISQFLQGFLIRSGSKLPIKKSYIYCRPIFFTDLKNDLKSTEGLKFWVQERTRKINKAYLTSVLLAFCPLTVGYSSFYISVPRDDAMYTPTECFLLLFLLWQFKWFLDFNYRHTATTADDLWCWVYLKNRATATISHSHKPRPC